MILYSPKGTKNWTSSGVIINNLKLEMSSFSFIEETFIASLSSYALIIIGKNIIGSGNISISIYVDGKLYLSENILFDNIRHSKKQFSITCILGAKIKVLLSRGGHSRGRVLIDHVNLYNANIISLESAITHSPLVPEIVITSPIELTSIPQPESIIQPIIEVKKEKKKRVKKVKQEQSVIDTDSTCIKKKERISAVIIDLNAINDERDIFNFINQINFGKTTQRFFIKQSIVDPKDFTKYNNVVLFLDEQDLISEIDNFDVFKIFFNKGNLSGALLKKAKEIGGAIV